MAISRHQDIRMKLFWAERHGDELYVFYCGVLIYKRWYKSNSNVKKQPSIIFNEQWPNEWINDKLPNHHK